jgi:membrane protein
MHGRLGQVRSGVGAVIREIRREDVTFMAASIAYHAFVSMLPILLLLMLVVSTFGSERFTVSVVDMTTALLPASGQDVVTDALRNATANVGLSVVGVAVLLWGTSKIFRAMDAAFAEIYNTERKLSIVDQFSDAIVVLFALALAAIGMIVLGSFVHVPGTVPFAWALNSLIAVVGLAVAFFPIYYVFPNIDVSLREVVPGVLVAAVGWVGLKWIFNLYVSVSNKPDVYGLIGTLVLLVTWLYVGGLILLVGAAVNAVLSGRGVNRQPGKAGKRRFGRQITDADSFEGRLDELVSRADDAGIPADELRPILRQQANTLGVTRTRRGDDGVETEPGPDER